MFFDNLEKLCIEHNTTPTVFITKVLKMGSSNVTRWKNGTLPNSDVILKISDYFNVTTDMLLKGTTYSLDPLCKNEKKLLDGYRELDEIGKGKILGRLEVYLEEIDNGNHNICMPTIEEGIENYNVSPLFKTELWGSISAGGGIDAIVNKEIIDSPVKCDFALRVRGDSMEPVFKNGSVIYLNQACEVQYDGEIAAVQIKDIIPTVYLKKVYIDEENFRLVSINSHYEDIILPASKVSILGKVVYPQV